MVSYPEKGVTVPPELVMNSAVTVGCWKAEQPGRANPTAAVISTTSPLHLADNRSRAAYRTSYLAIQGPETAEALASFMQ